MSDMENHDKSISIRDAERTDAPDIARLIIHAWPVEEFLKMEPGLTIGDLVRFLQALVEFEDNLYSYRVTKVAVLKPAEGPEKVVGMMNGYDGALYGKLKQPVLEAMAANFTSSGSFAAVTETEAGEFYLDSASVDPSVRSMGIGSMLFKAMLEKAASAGFKVAGLIVDEDKPKAEALYHRLGFKTVGSKDFMGHKMKHLQILL